MGRHKKLIDRAIALAKDSEGTKRAKHCCLLVDGKNQMSTGYNTYTTHPAMHKVDKNKIFLHSEVAAIMSVQHRDLTGGTMYVAKVSSANLVGMSRPCYICMQVARMFGIKKVVYTTSKNNFAIETI